jgi:4-hydroxythreonine-4-phosphate dehydrogenase
MKLAISIGDLNGVGIEIALKAHKEIKNICNPIYMISEQMLKQASDLLTIEVSKDFKSFEVGDYFEITPSKVTKKSGKYSYDSFIKAINLTQTKEVDAVVTLPINKEAWSKADIHFKGHTDLLADCFDKEAIMMIGCDKLFCAFFTHHIPLKDVAKKIKKEPLKNFLINFYNQVKEEKIGVLGLNPHAGDSGVIGDEEEQIQEAIKEANESLMEQVFVGPLVPDTAFTPHLREHLNYFVCMYHDQGLIAVKSLYFEESINVSLNLPIIRTSVDHGSAYDIAYKDKNPSTKSYINAVKEAIKLTQKHKKYII